MAHEESEDVTERETPADRWSREIEAAQKMVRRFHKQGDQVNDRYLDNRKTQGETDGDYEVAKLNLFHANITIVSSMLFGKLPKVDVTRKHADSDDDQARVASLMLGRMLNNSIEDPGENIPDVLRQALQDRLIPGLGTARVRYEYEAEMMEVEGEDGEVTEVEGQLLWENASIDYIHWRDYLWSWTRTWGERRWEAFKSYMDKEAMEARFGEDAANQAEYSKRKVYSEESYESTDSDFTSLTEEAEVWEIWHEGDNKVYWWTKGCDQLLDEKDDPLELHGFYPTPTPMVANVTTSLFMPKPDFCMAQDLYNEIDRLETRIANITRAIKVVGVYDKQCGELQRILKEGLENELIPVDSWAVLAEKGGLKGVMDWYPVGEVAGVLNQLRELRDENIALLHQITGLADIMRGSSDQYTAAASDKLKAKFGSIRIQALQDEFANFATGLMLLKAEVISKHFQPETIMKQSNIQYTNDAEMAEPAIQLIKSSDFGLWRVEVKAESVAMVDYAQLRSERTEYLTALSTFLQAGSGLVKEAPEAGPVLVQLLKWGLAGFKGSQEIEGVIDKALDEMFKAPPKQEPEDPKIAAEKAKSEANMQAEQQKHQNKMEAEQAKHQSKMEELQTKFGGDMEKMLADFEQDMKKIFVTGELNVLEETVQADEGIRQSQAEGMIDTIVDEAKGSVATYVEEVKADLARKKERDAD